MSPVSLNICLGGRIVETFLHILEKNDQPEWKDLKKQLVTRITNLTVVGALVASVAVTFVASNAPSPIANWDEMLPYISFLACGLFSAMCVVCYVFSLTLVVEMYPVVGVL